MWKTRSKETDEGNIEHRGYTSQFYDFLRGIPHSLRSHEIYFFEEASKRYFPPMGGCVSQESCACNATDGVGTLKEEGYIDHEGNEIKIYVNAKVGSDHLVCLWS